MQQCAVKLSDWGGMNEARVRLALDDDRLFWSLQEYIDTLIARSFCQLDNPSTFTQQLSQRLFKRPTIKFLPTLFLQPCKAFRFLLLASVLSQRSFILYETLKIRLTRPRLLLNRDYKATDPSCQSYHRHNGDGQ